MASAYDKLLRILSLERDQGCRDRAVIGGLGRFLQYWEREAREETDDPRTSSVDEILLALRGYAEMSVQAREHVLAHLVERLQSTEARPSTSPAPEPAAAEKTRLPDDGAETSWSESPADELDEEEEPEELEPRRRRPIISDSGVTLSSPVTALRGVSSIMETRLARLGLNTIRDVLYHFPRRYDDFTHLKTINHLVYGEEVTIAGVVWQVNTRRTRAGAPLTRCVLGDGTGTVELDWFNQPYLEKQLHPGCEIVVSGQVDEYLGRLVFNSPEWEPLERQLLHTGRLVPVYALTEGVRMRWLRRLIRSTLDYWVPRITDPLPRRVTEAAQLTDLGRALEQIHFPDDADSLERARQRLCFDEFFLLQLGLLQRRRAWRSQTGRALEIPEDLLPGLESRLPFQLTGAQQRAIATLFEDLQKPVPMNRLLQGDVGSGKTVVAVAALLATVRNGLQAAIMAPTAILAEQHHRTIGAMLADQPDIHCELLIGSLPAEEKRRIQEEVAAGSVQVVIGTHALIQQDVEFSRLGLVVVDEQHRFGVMQRGTLKAKGTYFEPHVLAMSATPIPRTLALTVYGDLDVSVLDELPPNRQKVITAVRDHGSRERIYTFISAQIKTGRQAFVICPLVEESDKIDAKAAVAEHKRLQEVIFPNLRVGLLHGRMSAEEKEQVMADFQARAYDILVSTAVVEVGIDIPNASIILIEGADRFGLATLHQFRGRVGRGPHKSYCILLADDLSEASLQRLQIMEETDDGFVLAEKDLEMRGPGDFFGIRQHGLPMLKIAKLSDTAVLEKARSEALKLFEEDAELALPEHQIVAASIRHFWAHQDLS